MARQATRRELLGFGTGMLALGLGTPPGSATALARWLEVEGEALDFGEFEPLVARMQESAPQDLLPHLVELLKGGQTLERLLAAAALANTRTHGGQDYNGYHAFMALVPALQMSRRTPSAQRALPVLKVLYRNTQFIRDAGGREREVLRVVEPAPAAVDGLALRALARTGDVDAAERAFAATAHGSSARAYAALQPVVRDEIDVHQVVLAWRVWDTLQLVGEPHAHTLLRQSLRHSLDRQAGRELNGTPAPGIRTLLPELLEGLPAQPGQRRPSDEELQSLALAIFGASRDDGARAMADALRAGFDPLELGEALSLAAHRLLMHDPGRDASQAQEGKPVGSVHGASVGVHASDAARAWRNIARTLPPEPPEQRSASLIVGAYHTAGQSRNVGANEFPWREELDEAESLPKGELPRALVEACERSDQRRAVAVAERLSRESLHDELSGLLLVLGTRADGALHAEKFLHTTSENQVDTACAFGNRYLIGLARVTASEAGFPAPGLEQARELLEI